MKKALILVALFAVTGIASAAMVNNPETFDVNGVLPTGWEAWGSGSAGGGWQGNGNGWSVSGGELTLTPEPTWTSWGRRMVFNHGNELAALPAGSAALGTVRLTFDVTSGTSGGLIKIEYYSDLAHNNQVGIDTWSSYDLTVSNTYTFVGTIPAGAVYVTPVIATDGVGTSITIDNVSLTGLAEVLPVINDPDYNDDDKVNLIDLSYLASVWQQTSSTYNLAGEEFIDLKDLQAFAAAWLRTSPYPGYNLVWSDEFNGTSIDTSVWTPETWGGAGQGELQQYTNNTTPGTGNSWVEDGNLIIQTKEESASGYNYTSGRIMSQWNKYWTYGRIEARIKLPATKGMFPAFWMMPEGWQNPGWPMTGEIDIVESIDDAPFVTSTIHFGEIDQNGNHPSQTTPHKTLPGGGSWGHDYHIYSVEWTPGSFEFFVDGVRNGSVITDWWTTYAPWPAPFNRDFFIIFNAAVGGWGATPDGSSVFPQRMYVDWVRVYQ
jgi:beta-glucanase (GH16 family)